MSARAHTDGRDEARAWLGSAGDACPEVRADGLVQSQVAQGYTVATIVRRLVTIRQAHRKAGRSSLSGSQAGSAGPRSRRSRSTTSGSTATGSSSRSAGPSPVRRAPGGGWACPTAPTPERARCGPGCVARGTRDRGRADLPAGHDARPGGDRALSDRAGAEVVKRRTLADGLDPARYSGHSLRAGLVTSAALAGASELTTARQTGHRSMAALRRCVREADLFRSNAAAVVGR